jgi:uncharacterized membrane protein
MSDPARRRRTPYSDVSDEQRHHARLAAADHKVEAVKLRFDAERTPTQRLADRLMAIAGSTPFLVAHALWFIGWIGWNVTGARDRFDPFPFGLLTLVVSLEAIFLSIFVLMSQRRESKIAELREEMTLEVDMRTEEEVTKVLQLVAGLYGRMGFALSEDDAELGRMLRPLDKERLEEQLTGQMDERSKGAERRRGGNRNP